MGVMGHPHFGYWGLATPILAFWGGPNHPQLGLGISWCRPEFEKKKI
jgi:hypothetical protein